MPKVGSEKYNYKDLKCFDYYIFFRKNREKSSFYIKIPEGIKRYINETVEGKTYEEAINNFKKKMEDYFKAV